MTSHRNIGFLVPLLLAASLPLPAAAPPVEVSFVDPAHYTDAGNDPGDARSNEEALARCLRDLGRRYLAPRQSLEIGVLDIDLAGTVRPAQISPIRVLRGGADWPRVKLRYTLREDGSVVSQGEEVVADLDYLHQSQVAGNAVPLAYEKRMLENWFRKRFGGLRANG
jgi:hypothetical protein